jgi:molecular chaperone DnaK
MRVQDELGIQVEDVTRVDPMTAVAGGAAIYCEGRNWTSEGSSAKVSRRTESAGEAVSVSFEYDARTASERARITIRLVSGPSTAEVRVDSTFGWSSQRRKLDQPVVLDLPLPDSGPNRFRATVFGANGLPVSEACRDIVIDRLLASTGGVPATQTIAAKILGDKGENTLDLMVHKGIPLPATGVVRYRLAAPLRAGGAGHIRIELYQMGHELVVDPTLNLMVGEFQINADELPEASNLRKGDEVIIHWAMSEGQEITAEVELPTVGQRFSRRKFYNWQLALQNFSGPDGAKLVSVHIEEAETDLEQAEEVLPPENAAPLPQIRRRLDDQLSAFRGTVDPDARRQVAEEVRLLRQEIAVLCQQPDARKELLRRNLRRALQFYDRFIRQDATQEQIVQIDSLARSAAAAIDRGGKADLDLAKDLVQQIDRLYWMHGFGQINFCIGCFKHHRESRYLATDPAKFDNSVAEGDRALASGDGETVRRVLFDILLDQRNVGPDAHAPEKAWLMRA